MIRNLATGLAALAIAGSTVRAQPSEEPDHARMKFVAERQALVPGSTNWLGVSFDIDPEWHLYWNGQNDAGFPIKITPTVPDGYKAGPLQWPAPKRHVSPGDLLDHVYEKRVTLLLPVEVPADAKPGSKMPISIEGTWLVCKSACVVGSGTAKLTLDVAAAGAVPPLTASAPLFDEARAKLPKPLTTAKPEVTVQWNERGVTLKANDAKSLAFYPSTESLLPLNLAKAGEAKGNQLELSIEQPTTDDHLVGVVEINSQQSSDKPNVYWIDVRRSEPNPRGSGASDSK